jgi:hypothetical protein
MRRVMGRIIKGSGGVTRERSFIVAGRKRETVRRKKIKKT